MLTIYVTLQASVVSTAALPASSVLCTLFCTSCQSLLPCLYLSQISRRRSTPPKKNPLPPSFCTFAGRSAHVSTPENSVQSRAVFRRQLYAVQTARNGGRQQSIRRGLGRLPIAAQNYRESPYFDLSLFSFDDKHVTLTRILTQTQTLTLSLTLDLSPFSFDDTHVTLTLTGSRRVRSRVGSGAQLPPVRQ